MIKTEGIVIRKNNTLSRDVFITIYTPSHGKIDMVSRNARSIKSKFAGCSKLFICGRFMVEEARFNRLKSCDIISSNYRLIDDYDRLITATYIVEIIGKSTEFGYSEPGIYYLLKDVLQLLNNSSKVDLQLARLHFLVNLAHELGILNIRDCCGICGCENPVFFNIKSGICCQKCSAAEGGETAKIDARWIRFMGYLLNIPCERILKTNIGGTAAVKISALKIVEQVLLYHLNISSISAKKFM